MLLMLLTPCIDYVIVFTRLAGGGDRRLLAAAPLLMLAQMVLLPVYLWLFVGSELADIVEPGPFLEAFALLIALPLCTGLGDGGVGGAGGRAGATTQARRGPTPVALMALTLLVVVASQFPRVRDDLGEVIGVVPIYVAFLVVMAAGRAYRARGCASTRRRRGVGLHRRDPQLARGAPAGARARRRVHADRSGDRHADAGRGARDGGLRRVVPRLVPGERPLAAA